MISKEFDDLSPVPPDQPERRNQQGKDAVQPADDQGQMSVEILRQKHSNLQNRTDKIDQGTWEFLGEQWRQLVFQIEDLNDAETLLREGVIKFTGRSSESKLKNMLEQIQRALYIQSALEYPPDRDWPSWIERPNAYKRALSLIDDIDMLVENENWPELRQRALGWRDVLLENILPPYLIQQISLAQNQARDGAFALALETIQNALLFIPEHLVGVLKSKLDYEGMQTLRDALIARQEGEAALWRGIVKLVNESASFQEIAADLNSNRIDHPDVDITDLRSASADLRKAAGIEAALRQLATSQKGAADDSRLERLSRVRFALMDQIPDFLVQADPRLSQQLQTRLSDLMADVNQAPQESLNKLIESFENQDVLLPQQVSDLSDRFWRLKRYLENGQISDPALVQAAQEALDWTLQQPHLMLLQAAQLFENLSGPVKLQELLINLDAVRSLSHNLPVNSKVHTRSYGSPNQRLPIDPEALEEWYRIITSWLKAYQDWSQQVKNTPQAGAHASNHAALEEIEAINQHLQTLKGGVWPRLELPAWGKDSAAGRIESECGLFVVLMEVFQEIEAERGSQNPIEISIYLNERLYQTQLLQNLKAPTIWFWEPLRRTLLKRAGGLIESVKRDIHRYLGELLGESQQPIRTLEQKVFLRPVPEEFVPTIRKSIENHAIRLSQNQDDTFSKAEWSSRWQGATNAARTWAGEVEENSRTPLNIKGLWLDLGAKFDWEARLDSILSRRREIGIAVGLVIFLTVFIFGGSAILRRSNLGDRSPSEATSIGGASHFLDETSLEISGGGAAPLAVSLTPTATHPPTEDTRYRTATAQAASALEATQAAVRELAATETQMAGLTASAAQAVMLDQTATARANQVTSTAQASSIPTADPALQVTNQAVSCLNDPNAHTLEISAEPILNPTPGTAYVFGSQAFPVYASWYVTNRSQCDWNELAVASLSGDEEPRYSFWDEVGRVDVSPETPIRSGDTVKVVLSFKPLDAENIDQDWAIVANELVLDQQPLLELRIQGWIIPMEATPTNTPRPQKEEPSTQTTSPPPTSRP